MPIRRLDHVQLAMPSGREAQAWVSYRDLQDRGTVAILALSPLSLSRVTLEDTLGRDIMARALLLAIIPGDQTGGRALSALA
jgi:hypothetical protein